MTEMTPRAARSDSVRNRAAILAAAHAQITAHGPDVGMADIAAAAGVAVGTLYRHFPTKTDLVAAVVAQFVSQMADRVEGALAAINKGRSASKQLRLFLTDAIEAAGTNRAVKSAAHALGADTAFSVDERRAREAMTAVLRAAHATGYIRGDVTVDDIYLLVATAPADQPSAVRERWIDLITRGICPTPKE